MDKNTVMIADIEKMSDHEIEELLKSCSVTDLISLNRRLFGADSNICKMVESWTKSNNYSETQLKSMISHACKNRIRFVKSDYEKAEYEKSKALKNRPVFKKIGEKIKNTAKEGRKRMLSKKDISNINEVIKESSLDQYTSEILMELVESCDDNELVTNEILEVVEEFVGSEPVIEDNFLSDREYRLAIYEACRNGEITEAERDEMLSDSETKSEKEDKIDKLANKKKSLETVADIDKNESRISKIKRELENKK